MVLLAAVKSVLGKGLQSLDVHILNWECVNTMDQDVLLGVTLTITQADLAALREAGRLGEFAVVYRVHRQQMGGGYGDKTKHPFAWGILVYVDGQLARIYSARGYGREWNDLDRCEKWLNQNGFWYWWTRNDLEALGSTDAQPDPEDTDLAQNTAEPGMPMETSLVTEESATAPSPKKLRLK